MVSLLATQRVLGKGPEASPKRGPAPIDAGVERMRKCVGAPPTGLSGGVGGVVIHMVEVML
jgi:hypothetical protein